MLEGQKKELDDSTFWSENAPPLFAPLELFRKLIRFGSPTRPLMREKSLRVHDLHWHDVGIELVVMSAFISTHPIEI